MAENLVNKGFPLLKEKSVRRDSKIKGTFKHAVFTGFSGIFDLFGSHLGSHQVLLRTQGNRSYTITLIYLFFNCIFILG